MQLQLQNMEALLFVLVAHETEPEGCRFVNFFSLFHFFVANTFQIQPFHKGLAMQADVAFCFMPGA
jgi:hypothetical protein